MPCSFALFKSAPKDKQQYQHLLNTTSIWLADYEACVYVYGKIRKRVNWKMQYSLKA